MDDLRGRVEGVFLEAGVDAHAVRDEQEALPVPPEEFGGELSDRISAAEEERELERAQNAALAMEMLQWAVRRGQVRRTVVGNPAKPGGVRYTAIATKKPPKKVVYEGRKKEKNRRRENNRRRQRAK